MRNHTRQQVTAGSRLNREENQSRRHLVTRKDVSGKQTTNKTNVDLKDVNPGSIPLGEMQCLQASCDALLHNLPNVQIKRNVGTHVAHAFRKFSVVAYHHQRV